MPSDAPDADGSADAEPSADGPAAESEDERGRLGRWGQHLLDIVEFVLDLF